MKKFCLHWKSCLLAAVLLTGLFCGCGSRNEQDLNNELSYRTLGISKMQEGNYQEAVTAFEKALTQSAGFVDELEVDICYYKAQAQYLSGDVQGAADTCTALIEFDKENSDAYYLRGTIYFAQGLEKEGLEDYQSAVNYGRDGKLYNKMAQVLMLKGYQGEAQDVLKQALKLEGTEAADYRNKGYTYYLQEEYENARTYLDKAIGMGDKEAGYYLALLEEALGNREQADALYRQYTEDNGDDPQKLNDMGCEKMAEGDYQQALTCFRQALQVEEPINEQALRRNEIVALERLLDFSQAKEKMASYVEDYPEDEAAARENEFLKTR